MFLFTLVPIAIVCWLFAYRYLAGRKRTLSGGQPFVYEFWDSPLFAGQRANPTWLLVLAIILILTPFVAAGTIARRDIERAVASFRNACPNMLTDADILKVTGVSPKKPHDFGSQYGCRRDVNGPNGNTLVSLSLEPTFFATHDFKREHEAKGASVTAIDFGSNGLLALPKQTKQEADAQAKQADDELGKDIASTKLHPPRANEGANRKSPMDRWLDSLPFEGADVHTEKCGVSIDLHVGGDDAESHARAFAAIVSERLDLACRYQRH